MKIDKETLSKITFLIKNNKLNFEYKMIPIDTFHKIIPLEILDEEGNPGFNMRIKCKNGNTIERFYDRKSHSFVTMVIDSDGYQIGQADYSGDKKSADHMKAIMIKDNGGELSIQKIVASAILEEVLSNKNLNHYKTRRPLYKRILAELKDIVSYSYIEQHGYRFHFTVHHYGYEPDKWLGISGGRNEITVLKPGMKLHFTDENDDELNPPLNKMMPVRSQLKTLNSNLDGLSDDEIFNIVVDYFKN